MRGQLSALVALLTSLPSTTRSAVYDRSITVFSPQGNLQQVTYAEEAVQYGSLAAAVTNGRDTIAIALERPNEADEEGTGDSKVSKDAIDIAQDEKDAIGRKGRKRHRRKPSENGTAGTSSGRSNAWLSGRGLAMGISDDANNQDQKLCEVDEGIFLSFSGIAADGRALVSKIRLECQNYRYRNGVAPSVGYIAGYVGGLQHQYTRTGGARPFGVSCLIAGFDPDGTPRIFRSEPSGAFAEWKASAVGKASEKALGKLEESDARLDELDWRETTEAANTAALIGGAKSCDIVVLRQIAGTRPRSGETAGLHWPRDGTQFPCVSAERFVGFVSSEGQMVLEPLEQCRDDHGDGGGCGVNAVDESG